MDKRCVVVIPIYKEHLDNFEILSLHRLYQVLGHKYDIKFLTYYELDSQEYANIAYLYGHKSIERVHFPKGYFITIKEMDRQGYNILFTDYKLYEKFLDYKYMFIYHLDCYIFYDNLEYWMNLNLPQVECVWDVIIDNKFVTRYYNGEGLRNTKVFYDFLRNNQNKVYEWFFKMITPLITNTTPNTSMELNGFFLYYIGEDVFFTQNISHLCIPSNIYEFGFDGVFDYKISNNIPMMLHHFQKYYDIKNIIGDIENDLQGCIDCPKFIKNELLKK